MDIKNNHESAISQGEMYRSAPNKWSPLKEMDTGHLINRGWPLDRGKNNRKEFIRTLITGCLIRMPV